jgi:fructose-specific phosphotransferase system IIB component
MMERICIVAVTSCPSGVAHTYMAAEALERAAKKRNCKIKVETQSSLGVENEITRAEADAADVVILTRDVKIDGHERFAGKPIVTEYAAKIIRNAEKILDAALKSMAAWGDKDK